MHRFWDTIIEPLLRALDARRILEIGSDAGDNTRHLLDYCQEVDGFLEVVDPLPQYDSETWFEPWPGRVSFHRDLSLNILPQIAPVDVALIDGDHNWYTVYHELKLIDKAARQAGQPFPLVLLHDIEWPYGRRDLYYDPDTIPVGHRKPYRTQGLRYGESRLAETGGLNQGLCNSIYEHNHQNGVLTAVEDFLAEIGDALRFERLPGIHGLGILYPAALEDHDAFSQFMLEIRPTLRQRRFMEMIEAQRLILQVRDAEQQAELRDLHQLHAQRMAQIQQSEQEQAALTERLSATEQERDVSAHERETLAERLQTAEAERIALADRCVHSEQTRHALSQQLEQAETERAALTQKLTKAETERANLAQKLASLTTTRAQSDKRLAEQEQRLAAQSRRTSELEAVLQRYRGGIERLEKDYQAVKSSARWRVGCRVVRLLEILLLRGKPPLVMDRMADTFAAARNWGPRPPAKP